MNAPQRSATRPVLFITGSDTGVGKTVFTALLARHLCAVGVRVAALKPVGSGGRADARTLRRATGGTLALDEINPWHFRAALAPPLAAEREGRRLRLAEIVRHIQRVRARHDLLLVEGAGGLLSPLAEDGDNRDLLRALRARPLVVIPDRLGAINQARLVHAALSAAERRQALWVLVAPRRVTTVQRLNRLFLRRQLGADRVFGLPFLTNPDVATPATVASLAALSHVLARRSPR